MSLHRQIPEVCHGLWQEPTAFIRHDVIEDADSEVIKFVRSLALDALEYELNEGNEVAAHVTFGTGIS